jgi:uncharacterized protein YoxC
MSITLQRPAKTGRRASTAGGAADVVALLPTWRPALDALGTNVFIADLSLTIVFANRKAHATLKVIEPVLQRSFGVSAAEIVGGSIHRFHKDPARVERVLHKQGFTLPHDATFSFGGVSLSTRIDGVVDDAGRTIGYAVAWEDVTALMESNAAVQQLGDHLDMAASAVEELSSSIGEIARSTHQAADVSTRGVSDAETTTSAVRELDEASAAVGDVVRTITAIAEQTNILALNATIEAARAGEAGRGFAVVAGEVKQLARDTATATGDIDKRIGAIRDSVDTVARSIETIANVLREVHELQTTVAATVEQQRAATDQLARSVAEAATTSRNAIDQG